MGLLVALLQLLRLQLWEREASRIAMSETVCSLLAEPQVRTELIPELMGEYAKNLAPHCYHPSSVASSQTSDSPMRSVFVVQEGEDRKEEY